LRGGLPHSEIPGSTIARISPGLFAACHVLHRLSVPRHPPDALNSRLSATPNGKNHSGSRSQEPGVRKAFPNRRCLAPAGVRQTLLSEDTAGFARTAPVFHKTGPHAGLPLRSHNSLLYDCPSTKYPSLPMTGTRPRHVRVLLAAFSGSTGRRRLSQFAVQTTVGAHRPSSSR
jgi:hypothetical protein